MDRPDHDVRPDRILLLFVDGIGWGEADAARNPLLTYGGPLLRVAGPDGAPREHAGGAWARPIDALLGVPGIPQSATGQTTLLTGVNAQRVIGKHLTGFPNQALREILLEHSILKQATARGWSGAFLNAFRPRFFELPRERQLMFSATTVANLAADLPFLTLDDLVAKRAVYQDFTNRDLVARGFDVPERSPAVAGRILARCARAYDFAFFEYFQTDRAGHRQDRDAAEEQLRRLDGFVGAVLAEVGEVATRGEGTTLVVLTSDHGNLEDLGTRRHTTHPVPLLAWGPGALDLVAATDRLSAVTPGMLRLLAERPGRP
jgi:2,3-bisphosphoglycerate-independent phosphoglycerate mutase